jgi:hypothetical protein
VPSTTVSIIESNSINLIWWDYIFQINPIVNILISNFKPKIILGIWISRLFFKFQILVISKWISIQSVRDHSLPIRNQSICNGHSYTNLGGKCETGGFGCWVGAGNVNAAALVYNNVVDDAPWSNHGPAIRSKELYCIYFPSSHSKGKKYNNK